MPEPIRAAVLTLSDAGSQGERVDTAGPVVAEMLRNANFEVAETAYYQFLLFPLVLASRVLGRVHPRTAELEEQPPPRVNGFLRRVSELEVQVGSRFAWPWGSTLALAAGRKRA